MSVSTPPSPGLPSARGDGRPPAREGIPARRVVLRGEVPVGQFWAARAGDSPFAPGELLVPGTALDRPVPAWMHPEVPAEPEIPFDYEEIFSEDGILVVDKPHFLPVTGNGRIQRETVQTRLRRRRGDDVVACHRLDRLTAGLVLCSLEPATRGAYQQLFARREVAKTYQARLTAPVNFPEWTRVDLPMRKSKGSRQVRVVDGGTPTTTWIRDVGHVVQMRPVTGHTHQLRVVAAHLGAPIVGDDTYPVDAPTSLWDYSAPLHLLASRLEFVDPITGEARGFVSRRRLPDTMSYLHG